jgi:predicted phage terminase large subunit-like protein
MTSSASSRAFSARPPSLAAIRAERNRRAIERERRELERNAEAIRERCQSLYEFVREFWHVLEPATPFVGGWAIRAICMFLEAVTAGRIQYLLITVPPGMAKSLLVSVFWPAWEWGPKRRPELRFLSTSYSRPNVIRDNRKMARLVESEKFQRLWGDVVRPSTKWGEEKFENEATGFREGRPFVSMTGGRGDRVIIDDPHSVDSAESDAERNNVTRTFRESIPDRVNDIASSAIVVIMQRLHAKDVAGVILELKLPYVHLNLPMEFEARRVDADTGQITGGPCEVWLPAANDNGELTGELELFFRDPRTAEGELLFPERFGPVEVAGLKRVKGPYAWAGQYQQRPTAREGGLFKRKWFEGKVIAAEEVPATRKRVRAWDRAGTKEEAGKEPDWTAGVRMSRNGPDYYIEHVTRTRDSPGQIRRLMKSIAETDPPATIIRIPQEPGQAGVDQMERDAEYFSGWRLKFERPTGAKEVRAEAFSIQCEFGHVYLVAGPWVEPFLDELCAFPGGANDDQVDAASDAFNELAGEKVGRFEVESAGPRIMAGGAERDSRYNFGDTNPAGAVSARSLADGTFG